MKRNRLGTDPFGGGLDGLIRQTTEGSGQSNQDKPSIQSLQDKQGAQGPGRPRTSTRKITKSTQEGTREGWERATYIVRQEYIEKIKAVAYWDRKEIKEVIDEALKAYLDGKNVKPRPEGR